MFAIIPLDKLVSSRGNKQWRYPQMEAKDQSLLPVHWKLDVSTSEFNYCNYKWYNITIESIKFQIKNILKIHSKTKINNFEEFTFQK